MKILFSILLFAFAIWSSLQFWRLLRRLLLAPPEVFSPEIAQES